MHPYFVQGVPAEETNAPAVEFLSRLEYRAGSSSVPVRIKLEDGEGLQQVSLFVTTREPHGAAGFFEVKSCRPAVGKEGRRRIRLRRRCSVHRARESFRHRGPRCASPGSRYQREQDPEGLHPYADLPEPDRQPRGALRLGRLGGLFARWDDPGFGVERPHRQAVGPGNASACRYPGARGLPDRGGVFTRRQDPGCRGLLRDQALGPGDANPYRYPGARRLDLGGLLTRWDDARLRIPFLGQAVGTWGRRPIPLPWKGSRAGSAPWPFPPTGRCSPAGLADGMLQLWDVKTGRLSADFKGHVRPVNSVAFSPDSKVLASADNGGVKLWDTASGLNTATLSGKRRHASSVAFSPDGATFGWVSGSQHSPVGPGERGTRRNYYRAWGLDQCARVFPPGRNSRLRLARRHGTTLGCVRVAAAPSSQTGENIRRQPQGVDGISTGGAVCRCRAGSRRQGV